MLCVCLCVVLIRGVLRAWPTFPLGLISDWIDSLLMNERNEHIFYQLLPSNIATPDPHYTLQTT